LAIRVLWRNARTHGENETHRTGKKKHKKNRRKIFPRVAVRRYVKTIKKRRYTVRGGDGTPDGVARAHTPVESRTEEGGGGGGGRETE